LLKREKRKNSARLATESKKIDINGIVQGVGFRPFVYQLAKAHHLKGNVANTASGVLLHIEGLCEDIESFCRQLKEKAPPLSHITQISIQSAPAGHYRDFSIVQSKTGIHRFTLISPDMSICDDCRRELFDPKDRRYGYPFINCTNCGPRYTIIEDIPYDRPKTSMKHFTMCPQCQHEYDDPENRRFHAQPNACPVCGPRISLHDNKGGEIFTATPVEQAVTLLKQGFVLAIKGLGGFHLAVDAENAAAVQTLRKRKLREEKPLAVMSFDLSAIRQYAHISREESTLLASPQRPIVLLRKRQNNPLAAEISPGNRTIGAMLPYTPLHYLLLRQNIRALVMTSGNLSEEPIAIDNADAFDRLKKIADFFLIHDRDIYLRSDDSVVKRIGSAMRFFRRSRGYVPIPVFLKETVRPVLACGAELKNTICLTKENYAFLSQHVGDLENLATYTFFKKTIAHLKRILSIKPEIVAFDMHPDYLSTQYAKEQEETAKVAVQHHHAHIVSCMAENKVSEQVVGLSFDGTGYGTDGKIWGGEILLARYERFDRLAHLSYTAMPGGAAAIKEPWRMAVSYLHRTYGKDLFNLNLPLLQRIEENKIRIIVEMIEKKVNSPETSSLGRLFDGIAAIAGIRQKTAYEGQAAMELEMMAGSPAAETYAYDVTSGSVLKIEPQAIVEGVVSDMENNVELSRISAKFHATLIRMFSQLCERLAKETRVKHVALSGGVFQNSILLAGLKKALEKQGVVVLTHEKVPTNDGGIALGQAVIADAVSR
jgi:hydrogenase maturation protein HypF